jgi:hypothetical protein
MSASPARPSTAWYHAASACGTCLATMPQVITRCGRDQVPLVAGALHVASTNGHGIGQIPRSWCGAVGTPRPRASARVTRVGLRATRVDALSWASRPFALRIGPTVCLRRSYGSTRRICAVVAHLASRWPGLHREGRPHDVGDEFEARAPDGADAREPRQASSRGTSDPRAPRSPSQAPTASNRLTSRRPSGRAPDGCSVTSRGWAAAPDWPTWSGPNRTRNHAAGSERFEHESVGFCDLQAG